MKKFLMVWLPLLLIVAGGVGVGFYFLRSSPGDEQVIVEDSPEYKEKTITEAYTTLASTKHLVDYQAQSASLTKLESAVDAVLFAPTKSAIDAFVVETSLGFPKFIPYHVVVSDTPITVDEGAKLTTDDGQEVIIVKTDNILYVRDAKGNDVRLRKPVETKNGRIYIIDKVLLTQ